VERLAHPRADPGPRAGVDRAQRRHDLTVRAAGTR
jgi:hypothetical protein